MRILSGAKIRPGSGLRLSASSVRGQTSPAYSTTFSADENPISESGNWAKNASNAWAEVRTVSGNATGTQGLFGNSGNDYNDSYAILQGDWGADYELDAIIYRSASISSANHEVELNGRFVDDADSVRGYEVLLNKDGTIQCFRWNDSFGSFSAPLTQTSGSVAVGSVPDGARLKVRYQGDIVTVYYSSDGSTPTQQCTFDIDDAGAPKYTDGNPAIAFFCRPDADGSNPDHFGFKSVTVTKL